MLIRWKALAAAVVLVGSATALSGCVVYDPYAPGYYGAPAPAYVAPAPAYYGRPYYPPPRPYRPYRRW